MLQLKKFEIPNTIEPSPDWLSISELNEFSKLVSKKRQQQWLAARLAAKKLIQNYFNSTDGLNFHTHEISIKRGLQNEPLVFINDQLKSQLSLSISHCADLGLVALSEVETEGRIGVDVEIVRSVNPNLAHRILNPSEMADLLNEFSSNLDEGLTLYWSLKEAAFKCLRPLIPITRKALLISFRLDGRTAKIEAQGLSKQFSIEAEYEYEDCAFYCLARGKKLEQNSVHLGAYAHAENQR